jgi:hypothetical protein
MKRQAVDYELDAWGNASPEDEIVERYDVEMQEKA